MSAYLIDYPFAGRLFPSALKVLKRLADFGPTVILSDGDVVFQPHKVEQSGQWRKLAEYPENIAFYQKAV